MTTDSDRRKYDRQLVRILGFSILLGVLVLVGSLWGLSKALAMDVPPSGGEAPILERPVDLLRMEWPLLCVGTLGHQWIRSYGDRMHDKRPQCVDADLTKRERRDIGRKKYDRRKHRKTR